MNMGMFKKAARLREAAFGEARSSKAAELMARGAYTAVREHVKSSRTLLAVFFNTSIIDLQRIR